MSINSRFKSHQITGQRQIYCRQRIPISSCVKKETVAIDILITSRNNNKNHAIYQNNEWASHENKKAEPAQEVQMIIYLQKRLKQVTFRRLAKVAKEVASEGINSPNVRFCSLSNISKRQLAALPQTGQKYSMQGRTVDLQR